jgi:hypothetical protein
MNALEMTEKVQDGVLKAVETSQAWTLGALRSTSSAFDGIKPDPSLIPFADKVPTPTESLEVAFGFMGKLLDAQQSFLTGIVEIYAPPMVKVTTPATATATATPKKI